MPAILPVLILFLAAPDDLETPRRPVSTPGPTTLSLPEEPAAAPTPVLPATRRPRRAPLGDGSRVADSAILFLNDAGAPGATWWDTSLFVGPGLEPLGASEFYELVEYCWL